MRILRSLAAFSMVLFFARAASADAFDDKVRADLVAVNSDAGPAFDEAARAATAGDMDGAARGYEHVLELVPGSYHAERRLCGIESARGHRDRALTLCRQALATKDTPENHAALAAALLDGDHSLADIRVAKEEIDKARAELPNDRNVLAVTCRYALAAHDVDLLKSASTTLVKVDDADPYGHFFAALAAGYEGRLDDAQTEVDRARERGLPDNLYRTLNSRIGESRPLLPRLLKWGAATLLGWFALLGFFFAAGSMLSQSALRAASRVPASGTGHAHGVDGWLRKLYRVVLWAACGFYYVSLPLLAVVMVGLGAGLVYACLAMGQIPIKLILILGIAIFSTLVAIVRSLFVKVREEDPGERIDLAAHPRLREVLEEVAGRIGTRPVDHVYLTPFTDIAVLERGGVLRQLRGTTERALVLGAGVLHGMRLRAFKGILAHEYGHFHNEDTAGGGFALGVRRSVLAMAIGLARSGQAGNLNPAWWFTKGFQRVFLRISQGASRLQEVLADRWAAFAYGSAAFEEGLRHVIQRSLTFDAHTNFALNEVLQQKRPLANLYQYAPEKTATEEQIEEAFDKAWNADPSPYDSHPRPADRATWVRAFDAAGVAAKDDDADDAWTLFANRDALEQQMTAVVRVRIATNMGVQLTG